MLGLKRLSVKSENSPYHDSLYVSIEVQWFSSDILELHLNNQRDVERSPAPVNKDANSYCSELNLHLNSSSSLSLRNLDTSKKAKRLNSDVQVKKAFVIRLIIFQINQIEYLE